MNKNDVPDTTPEEAAPVEEAPVVQIVGGVGVEEFGYTVGTWAGMPNYECKSCPWSTVVSEDTIAEHVYGAHILTAAAIVASIPTTEEV